MYSPDVKYDENQYFNISVFASSLCRSSLEAAICFRVWNGMKSQLIQKKTPIWGTEVGPMIFCEWLQASKHVKNERTQARNNLWYAGM